MNSVEELVQLYLATVQALAVSHSSLEDAQAAVFGGVQYAKGERSRVVPIPQFAYTADILAIRSAVPIQIFTAGCIYLYDIIIEKQTPERVEMLLFLHNNLLLLNFDYSLSLSVPFFFF